MDKALQNAVHDSDIVIVGGGLVGNSLAVALSGLGFRLALVDNKPELPSTMPLAEMPAKALALSVTTQRFFEATGLWPGLLTQATPITAVHVSEQGRFGRTLLRAAEQGLPALGFVLDSVYLDHYLRNWVGRLPDVKQIHGTTVTHYRSLTNALIVAADGADSVLKTQAGIGSVVHDYQQTAIVANIQLKQATKGMAYERFTPSGPIAMLPVGDQQVKCVWVVSGPEAAEALRALPDVDFIEALGNAFGHRLDPILGVGVRSTYPLVSRVADALYGERLVLIGNAAATLHPIAAQGFNLAIRDVASLAETVLKAKQQGREIGSVAVLQAYAAQRSVDREQVIQLTHGLAQAFETSRGPIKRFRHWGMLLTDVLPPLKKWVTHRGMGFQYPLPRLCCGAPLCP